MGKILIRLSGLEQMLSHLESETICFLICKKRPLSARKPRVARLTNYLVAKALRMLACHYW
jgi:hypothetical protein